VVYGISSTEIAESIKSKQKELNSLNEEKIKIQQQKLIIQESINLASSELDRLTNEIKILEEEIKLVELEFKKLEYESAILEYRRSELEVLSHKNSVYSYKDWRSRSPDANFFLIRRNQKLDQIKKDKYFDEMSELIQSDADRTFRELAVVYSSQQEILQKKNEIEKSRERIASRKKELENLLADLKPKKDRYSNILNDISKNIEKLSGDISFLTEEQKKAIARESQILSNNNNQSNGSNPPLSQASGDFYFRGRGRDIYQGHGVGMSQWGAHGMALAGFNYEQILKFYYTGVEISLSQQQSIPVQGYGVLSLEDYVAGQAEVPSKACGNEDQVLSNPSKYILDDPNNIWDCWPEEAIKAQVIAFRTYGLNYVNRNGRPICTDAYCQVFRGDKKTLWAAEETAGLVLTYNGEIIEALYSSDNNQGFGTANNDTVFVNFAGDGIPYPYLRAVNDSLYSTKTGYTDWIYNTSRYTLSSIYEMLSFAVYDSRSNLGISSLKTYISSVLSNSTSIKSLRFERDPSMRVKKVYIEFDDGVRTLGGYWFKYVWNSWQYALGRNDFIYSLTFDLVS